MAAISSLASLFLVVGCDCFLGLAEERSDFDFALADDLKILLSYGTSFDFLTGVFCYKKEWALFLAIGLFDT